VRTRSGSDSRALPSTIFGVSSSMSAMTSRRFLKPSHVMSEAMTMAATASTHQ
jgi:hypothetical protein